MLDRIEKLQRRCRLMFSYDGREWYCEAIFMDLSTKTPLTRFGGWNKDFDKALKDLETKVYEYESGKEHTKMDIE